MHPATVTRKTPATLGRFNELTPPPPAPATQAPPPVKKYCLFSKERSF